MKQRCIIITFIYVSPHIFSEIYNKSAFEACPYYRANNHYCHLKHKALLSQYSCSESM
jgi:hypothetical protein